jgi:hypothetical protein
MRDKSSSDSLDYLPTDGKTGIVGTAIKGLSAIISFTLIAGIVIWSYRLGVRDANDLPVIQAMEGAARIQPEDPGGTQAEHQGLEVNGVLANNEAPPVSAEVSNAPNATQLTEEDAAQGTLNAGETESAETAEAGSVEELIAGLGEAATEPLPEAEAAVPAGAMASLRPQPRPADLDTTIDAGEEVFTAIEPETIAATAETGPEIKPGDRLVQLGAFDTKEIAEEQWNAVLAANGDLLGDKQYVIQEATSGGRIFYRLRVTGFAGLEDSRAMCSALQPREVPCIPVTAR